MPLVSVLLPVYNGERYLAAALASIRRQSFRDFELLVIDDGSTDHSDRIMDAAAADDARIHIIRRGNTGIVRALNEALAAARGEFIARMDGDDIAHPTRFQQQLDFLHANPGCVMVGCAVRMIDPAGHFLKILRPKLDHVGIVEEALDGNGGALIHPTIFFRHEAVRRLGGYHSQFHGYAEDLDLYLRLSEVGELANLPEPLLDYRVHLNSYNHTRSVQQLELVRTAANNGRRRRNLPELAALPAVADPGGKVETHLRWAGWAIEGGHPWLGCWHAFQAFVASPGKRTRSFLSYALSVARRQRAAR